MLSTADASAIDGYIGMGTTFTGDWSWVPYVIVFAALVIGAAEAIRLSLLAPRLRFCTR